MAKFCTECGEELKDGNVCPKCTKTNAPKAESKVAETTTTESKSKVVAGILALFFGTLGVHNFYLGFKSKAITQLVLTIVGFLTSILLIGIPIIIGVSIWVFVEAILLLTGSIKTDADGNTLV
ncbi:MAG: TM2 domain-containing protein [bacterium]|nr:TM2 domain-containing protein [bacterium]